MTIETKEEKTARLARIEAEIVEGCTKHIAAGGKLLPRSLTCALCVTHPGTRGFCGAGYVLGMRGGEAEAFTVGFDSVDGLSNAFPEEAEAYPELVAMGRRIADLFGVTA